MVFRTIVTNPQEIPVFESTDILLTYQAKGDNEKLTPYKLNLSKLALVSDFRNLNQDYIITLVGVIGDLRIEEDICTVAEILRMPQTSVEGALELKGKKPKFSLYFHSKSSIKKQATSQTFLGRFDNTIYEALLPVVDLENSNAIWDIELSEEEGPMLQINRKVLEVEIKLLTKVWQSLILPMAIKKSLEFLILHREDGGEGWQLRWESFVEDLCGSGTINSIPRSEDSEQEKEAWVSDIIESFTSRNNYIEHINLETDQDLE